MPEPTNEELKEQIVAELLEACKAVDEYFWNPDHEPGGLSESDVCDLVKSAIANAAVQSLPLPAPAAKDEDMDRVREKDESFHRLGPDFIDAMDKLRAETAAPAPAPAAVEEAAPEPWGEPPETFAAWLDRIHRDNQSGVGLSIHDTARVIRCLKLRVAAEAVTPEQNANWAGVIAAGVVRQSELGAELASLQERVESLDAEHEQLHWQNAHLQAENERLRSGAELGPIIGAQTIVEQEIELKRLRADLQQLDGITVEMYRAVTDEEFMAAFAKFAAYRAQHPPTITNCQSGEKLTDEEHKG